MRHTVHAGSGLRRPREATPESIPHRTSGAGSGIEPTISAGRQSSASNSPSRPHAAAIWSMAPHGACANSCSARCPRRASRRGSSASPRQAATACRTATSTAAEEPTPLPSGTSDEMSMRSPWMSTPSSRARSAIGPRTYAAQASPPAKRRDRPRERRCEEIVGREHDPPVPAHRLDEAVRPELGRRERRRRQRQREHERAGVVGDAAEDVETARSAGYCDRLAGGEQGAGRDPRAERVRVGEPRRGGARVPGLYVRHPLIS